MYGGIFRRVADEEAQYTEEDEPPLPVFGRSCSLNPFQALADPLEEESLIEGDAIP